MLKDLSAVQRTIETARGLPNAFYVSEDLLKAEKASVFSANWTAIGFGKDVPQPGDTYPVTFMGSPLLIVRDRGGGIRVYHNVCRHRGMILVEKPKRMFGAIRCPYHSWCYDLNGKLRSMPHAGGPGINGHEALKRDELGLVEVRSHVWRDVVFANISGTAPAFEKYAGDLIARWSDYEQPLYHGGEDSSFELDLRANWKLAVDNYCESYHLPWVHPGLNSYSRLEDHYTITSAGGFSGQGTQVYNPALDPAGREFARFRNLDPKWDRAAEYVALYPNVLFGVHKDHAYAVLLEPRAYDKTIERTEIYYADEAMAGSDWASLRRKNTELWKGVFAEDVSVCEGMQRGRFSEGFDGGRFSPVMDGGVHIFHAWIARNMSNATAAVAAA
jgi:phenylpropionate dioxygenase-like ring-hydroxylating dioxygenase large terminal subunit